MKLRCQLFGHVPNKGYYGVEGGGYFEVVLDAVDGLGVQHARLYTKCERCGDRYRVGMIRVPRLPAEGSKPAAKDDLLGVVAKLLILQKAFQDLHDLATEAAEKIKEGKDDASQD